MNRTAVIVVLLLAVGRAAPPVTADAPVRSIRVGIAAPNGIYTVRAMPLEEYVAGVVAGEALKDSSPAALEALAITVRTFALANAGRHRSDGFDLCDQTHCQVLRRATAATARAADATAAQVLLYRGAPASVFYTASCGGHTERPSAVWPGAADPAYLPSREDDACEGQPAWTADLTASQLASALRAGGFVGDSVRELRILERNGSGRVTQLRVDGFAPDRISGQDLRTIVGRAIGWQFIKSTAFTVAQRGTVFHFAGHGYGHGVGLCVIGSARLAANGESSRKILARYFPGLEISDRGATVTAATSDVTVALPAGDDGERDVIRSLIRTSRDAMAGRLGVAPPAQLSVRFHATVDEYQRATGEPWFSASSTSGGELHFVPLAVLRDRGVLERTVRREIIRSMTASALQGRPLWVREGAASYFSAEPTIGDQQERRTSARVVCPSDDELRRPSSPGEMTGAWARATSCFARQIAAGKSWRDVK